MAIPTFPISPLPADLTRLPFWKVDKVKYDSGARQAMTSYMRPLFRYSVPMRVYNEVKQQVLYDFVNTVMGETMPFFMKDPYDFRVNSVLAVRSGLISGATLYMYDIRSWRVYADTTTVLSLHSTLSGFVNAGAEFTIEQDTGILRVNTKDATDVWGVRSLEFFRKCAFEADYVERARLWNIFGTDLTIEEMV